MLADIRWAVEEVLTSGPRRRFLFSGGTRTLRHLAHFLKNIVPQTRAGLADLRESAAAIPDAELRRQALASIEHKAYHVAGAAILATFLERDAARRYVDAVVPLETIYDYLDNVCDRHPQRDAAFFPTIHLAIADALDPHAPLREYYADGPQGDDGGYLAMLVGRAQRAIAALAPPAAMLGNFAQAARLYAQMQTFTHLDAQRRELAAFGWYEEERALAPALAWNEFAAAAGSQFQIYGPLFEAAAGRPVATTLAYHAHFPNVAALHVLLDSFIDQAEDSEHGDLNLVRSYGGGPIFRDRAAMLYRAAMAGFERLPNPYPHVFAVRIMLLFYLSHPKVYRHGLNEQALRLLSACAAAAPS